MKMLNISGIISESIVDGPGIRYVIFVQGCPHQCPGCHNPQTHEFSGGTHVRIEDILAEIEKTPFIRGVTFSGGEPFCQAQGLYELAVDLKKRGKHLMIYTGYTWEELMTLTDPYVKALLSQCDLLVDGRYEEEQRDILLRFRGSSNQRILDVPKSLASGKPVCSEYQNKF